LVTRIKVMMKKIYDLITGYDVEGCAVYLGLGLALLLLVKLL